MSVDTSTRRAYGSRRYSVLHHSIVDGGRSVPPVDSFGDSDVTVRDLTMRNGSSAAGGAITADRVTARNVEFEANEAGFAGGAIAGREVDVRDSTFTGNTARVGGTVLASGAPDPAVSQGGDWMGWAVLGLLGLLGLTVVGIGTPMRRRP